MEKLLCTRQWSKYFAHAKYPYDGPLLTYLKRKENTLVGNMRVYCA